MYAFHVQARQHMSTLMWVPKAPAATAPRPRTKTPLTVVVVPTTPPVGQPREAIVEVPPVPEEVAVAAPPAVRLFCRDFALEFCHVTYFFWAREIPTTRGGFDDLAMVLALVGDLRRGRRRHMGGHRSSGALSRRV